MKLDSILRNSFYAITALKVLIILFIPEFRVWEPEEMALNLLAGKGFYVDFLGQHNYNYQFPLYPFMIFLVYYIFGPIQPLIVAINIVLYSIACLYFGRLLQLLIPKISAPARQVFQLLLLIYPTTNVYVLGNIHPFALDLLLCITGFYYGILWSRTYAQKHLYLAFLLLALILIDRITLIVAPAIGLLWGFIQSKSKARHLVSLFSLSILALIPLLCWMITTYQHNQRVALMSSTGVNLWIGIQEKTEGTAQLSDGESYLSLLSTDEISQLNQLSPMAQNDFFVSKYRSELNDNPVLFWTMMRVKLRNFWWFRTDLGVDYTATLRQFIFLYKLAFAFLLFMMMWGIAKAPKTFFPLMLLMAGISLFQAWFYVETRHRVLLEPFMLLISFYVVNQYIDQLKMTRRTIS